MTDFINQLRDLVTKAEKLHGCFFWTAPKTAADRRYMESRWSTPLLKWIDNDHIYTAEITVRVSCRNVYATTSYTKDGKVTNLTAIRNSLHRLESLTKEATI